MNPGTGRRYTALRRGLGTLVLVCALLGASAGPASGTTITVGSPLNRVFNAVEFGAVITLFHTSLAGPGANVVSPVTGRVVSWQVLLASGGPFRMRVLQPLGGNVYTAVGTSAPAIPTSQALQTFPTSLPIKAGQAIGLDPTSATDEVGINFTVPGSSYGLTEPPFLEGVPTETFVAVNRELAFNAQVVPQPSLVALVKSTGSLTGGTKVTLSGSYLDGATAVSFGTTPAKSFTVDSESQITAVSPPATTRGPVPVTVTTPGGVSAALSFTYNSCIVPKLKGMTMKGARKKLKKAECTVGNVKKLGDATVKTGRIVKQNPKPGKVRAAGAKVNVKLG